MGGEVGEGEAAGVDAIENEERLGGEREENSIPEGVEDRRLQHRNRRPSSKLLTNKQYIKLKRALSHDVYI